MKYLSSASSERPLSLFDAFPFQALHFSHRHGYEPGLPGARRSLCAITGSLAIGRRQEDGCSRPMLAA